ncbi:sporulation integral membrane protein YlbJ [Bacillus sp. FJAT-50079]|uniref:sporulation integral membrane protein YlbJ n=1 Tax=Bacillus sp. FJAT-50079 TaxID=2833577 RepID=UPI001BCA21E7|nr:sporulation integral membrane protein YlbJ [Bacillus sp. FJAT-50079]MBS4207737.1 sporulation integral membrane protein YlbJ [Bacillus sp. FJAT-50079]
MNLSKFKTVVLALAVSIMAISMIVLPEQSLEASARGLHMWWKSVFPALFPFFVISELLIGFGVVKFMGVFLEPLMRPLFKVPGVGGFAWAMGMASGFPAGAKLTTRLRMEEQITKKEAERLVSFTNSSSPLFIFGAVAVGFFGNPRLGMLLAATHYLGNFFVGIIMRFYGKGETTVTKRNNSTRPLPYQALTALHRTRLANKKPLGKLLGDAVISSIHTLLMIGGFIILFSVINKLLFHLQVTLVLSKLISYVLQLFQLSEGLSIPLIAGLFEITLGSKLASDVLEVSLMHKVIITSFILGFSGFSVQAQVASILAETDISFKPFFIARIFHGFIAGLLTYVLWKPFSDRFYFDAEPSAVPTFLQDHDAWWETAHQFLIDFGPPFTLACLFIYLLVYMKSAKKN